jgi:TetR/AcrR family transcriptional regulator, copper-responsive repressor
MVQKRSQEPESAKRRGRPRAYDPQTALARAAATFWKAGYAGTSLDDLVAATGMNRPSLYAAFGDKRELYLKTLQFYVDEYREIARKTLADDPALRVFLKRFYGAALDLYLHGNGRGCYSIGTAATEATVDPNVREFLADSTRATDAFMKSRIVKAKERGEIAKNADPTALAYLATATMHTIAIRSRAGVSRKDLETLVDAAINVICAKP